VRANVADEQPKPRAAAMNGIRIAVCITLGMLAGRFAGDAVKDSAGWWASVGVGTLAAMVVAVLALFVMQAIWKPKPT
jgi:hypothetical protein